MRSPEATTGSRTHRNLIGRINALNVAMNEQANAAASTSGSPSTSTATGAAPAPITAVEATLPTSPATGANALPASPPIGERSLHLPALTRYLSPPDTNQDALDILRLSFESPAEAAARSANPMATQPKSSTLAAGPPPIMDGPLFAPEQERNFPVPKYLDHSVWRSRMFTFPSPLKSPVISRTAPRLSSSSSASSTDPAPYSLLQSGVAGTSPQKGARKSQLAASLASAGGGADRDDWQIPLPTCWDQDDRCSLVEVSGDGLEVSFCGSGKNGDRDAAAVRANRHMPPHTGVYYYEVEIVSKGQSGYIAIGFSGLNVVLSRLPGWEPNSWGYHGDDGHSFASQGTGKAYGPTFSTGDVVGCGIDFTEQRAFFTKNGAFLGHVFEGLEGYQLYPSVGMRTPGEVVRANFGQAPFRFDVEQFVIARKLRLLRTIDETPVPERYCVKTANEPAEGGEHGEPARALDETAASLVSAYLTFHGFLDTANAFETQRAANRRRFADLSPPTAAAETEDVEMADESSTSATKHEEASAAMGLRQRVCRAVTAGQPDVALSDLEASPLAVEAATPGHPLHDAVFHLRCQHFIELLVGANSAASSTEMATDIVVNGKGKQRSMTPPGVDDALAYGQELDALYAGDERPIVREGLRRAFALVAYDDPRRAADVEVAWLASQAARDRLADQLNAAILDAQGQSARPVLESVYKQACVAVAQVGRLGNGAAALVDVPAEALL